MVNERGNDDVLQCGELRKQLVELEDETNVSAAKACEFVSGECEDVLARNFQASGIGFEERSHDLKQGCFSCSAGTNNADHFSGLDFEIDAFEHFKVSEGFVDVVERNHVRKFLFRGTLVILKK